MDLAIVSIELLVPLLEHPEICVLDVSDEILGLLDRDNVIVRGVYVRQKAPVTLPLEELFWDEPVEVVAGDVLGPEPGRGEEEPAKAGILLVDTPLENVPCVPVSAVGEECWDPGLQGKGHAGDEAAHREAHEHRLLGTLRESDFAFRIRHDIIPSAERVIRFFLTPGDAACLPRVAMVAEVWRDDIEAHGMQEERGRDDRIVPVVAVVPVLHYDRRAVSPGCEVVGRDVDLHDTFGGPRFEFQISPTLLLEPLAGGLRGQAEALDLPIAKTVVTIFLCVIVQGSGGIQSHLSSPLVVDLDESESYHVVDATLHTEADEDKQPEADHAARFHLARDGIGKGLLAA
mmetsp:Transcript_9575/g.33944  ORF Transcript_9575/g.33944 Transcript_9575/m.33944 type:complete len:345 (-) Transcript_9575:80-1114(-)